MRYATFRTPDARTVIGRLEQGGLRELALGSTPGAGLRAALAAGALARLTPGPLHALETVQLLPVIPDPEKILCAGINYHTHRIETGRAEAAHPAIFVRFANTLIGCGAPIVRPRQSTELDYEGELAVVIGHPGRHIPTARALDHIAGYSCFNDASVRDWQRHNSQFTPGKNFPATGAFGPWLVTPEEVGDPQALRVTTRLNGVVVQDQSTAEMIWPVAELVSYLSEFTALAPGDVIATGTPGGVGSRREPPLWMKPGDSVEVSIGPVGTLVNRVVQED